MFPEYHSEKDSKSDQSDFEEEEKSKQDEITSKPQSDESDSNSSRKTNHKKASETQEENKAKISEAIPDFDYECWHDDFQPKMLLYGSFEERDNGKNFWHNNTDSPSRKYALLDIKGSQRNLSLPINSIPASSLFHSPIEDQTFTNDFYPLEYDFDVNNIWPESLEPGSREPDAFDEYDPDKK